MFELTELDLISVLVNFSCELGQIMTRYDFLCAIYSMLAYIYIRLVGSFPEARLVLGAVAENPCVRRRHP